MPRRVPMAVPVSSQEDIATKVWAHVSRRLTSLAIPADIVKFIGKGAGTEIPADTSVVDLMNTLLARATELRLSELDPANLPADIASIISSLAAVLTTAHFNLTEFEQAYCSDESQVTLNTTGSDQSLGAKNLTVALPSGATVVRAIAVAIIIVANKTATAQNVDFNLKVAGTPVFSKDAVISFGAIESSTPITIAQDCTAQVTGDGTYAIEAEAQISAAQNVTFTTVYLLFVQYKMS